MKSLCVVVSVFFFLQNVQGASEALQSTYISYGASVVGCMTDGVPEAVDNALENANRFCSDKRARQIGEVEVLESHVGSCWVGTASGAAIKVQFRCSTKDDDLVVVDDPSSRMKCSFRDPGCPSGHRCDLHWSSGPFRCVPL